MQKSDFYYELPKDRIAQEPAEPRDSARMMVMDRESGALEHKIFRELPSFLEPGDLLVVNNSKVLPARLLGTKEGTGAACEILLLREQESDVVCGDGILTAEIRETKEDGNKIVAFTHPGRGFYEAIDLVGKLPLPHYIEKEMEDDSEYQTVYASQLGSAAAPTAGLHFTEKLLDKLTAQGIGVAQVTLHVGLGTFRPVKVDRIEDHHMHTEWYSVSQETAELIQKTKQSGHRVIAVGTTSCRTLESMWQSHGKICACEGETDIFMYPGFEFKVIDGLITNFHLPESTLIMLVSAFAGYEHTMQAYDVAVKEGYRFYSFGDAMLIL